MKLTKIDWFILGILTGELIGITIHALRTAVTAAGG